MTVENSTNIKEHVLAILAPYLKRAEIDPASLSGDDDLYDLGVFDSLELVNIYAELERSAGLVPDFERNEDPENFTSLNGIIKALSSGA